MLIDFEKLGYPEFADPRAAAQADPATVQSLLLAASSMMAGLANLIHDAENRSVERKLQQSLDNVKSITFIWMNVSRTERELAR